MPLREVFDLGQMVPKGLPVLIRGVNWVGDAVMTMPAMRAIRKAMPEADITLLVKPWVSGLFEKDPNVDQIMIYGPGHSGINGKLRLALALRQKDFKKAILLQNAFDAALICRLAGIPERIGYGRDARGWLLTGPVPCLAEDRLAHHSRYYLNLLEKAGIIGKGLAPENAWIYLGLEERLRARKGLAALGLKRPVVGLNPGAAFGPSKRWPAAGFRRLAEAIIGELGGGAVIFGSAKEAPAAEEIAEGLPGAVSMAGRTTLRELAAYISECDALVTNDSGPMHVGYAVGAPLVALFGSTSPALTGPPAGSAVIKKELPCSPCFKRQCARLGDPPGTASVPECMGEIAAPEVLLALKSVLPRRRAVFFDRDGTLCRDAGYLARIEDFAPFRQELSALSRLRRAGFKLIGVTNQSGINRGIVDEKFVREVNGYFIREHGFDAFYYCPHRPDERCSCRKPSPGMLFDARRDMGIDLRNSYMIGDKSSDVLAARAAGARAILVRGPGPSDGADFTASTLTAAVNHIIESEETLWKRKA
ncbi:MAG: lipopolysaccharide heptosyltransferase II [Nitrospiraceae bacterium]|nr:lipopolysaccharide heptosyltransferase II [Nitrospiraceae bacterium]